LDLSLGRPADNYYWQEAGLELLLGYAYSVCFVGPHLYEDRGAQRDLEGPDANDLGSLEACEPGGTNFYFKSFFL